MKNYTLIILFVFLLLSSCQPEANLSAEEILDYYFSLGEDAECVKDGWRSGEKVYYVCSVGTDEWYSIMQFNHTYNLPKIPNYVYLLVVRRPGAEGREYRRVFDKMQSFLLSKTPGYSVNFRSGYDRERLDLSAEH